MKYDEALKYAPNWVALKEVRETAAKQGSYDYREADFRALR